MRGTMLKQMKWICTVIVLLSLFVLNPLAQAEVLVSQSDNLTSVTDVNDYTVILPTAGDLTVSFLHVGNASIYNQWWVDVLDVTKVDNYLTFGVRGIDSTTVTGHVSLPAGSYLVRVRPHLTNPNLGIYALTVNFTGGSTYEREFNDTVATATPISQGTSYTGSIQTRSTGEEPADYYRFTLGKAGKVKLAFQHELDPDNVIYNQLYARILSDDGATTYLVNNPVVDSKYYEELGIRGYESNVTGTTESVLPIGTYMVKIVIGSFGKDYDHYQITVNGINNEAPIVTASPAGGIHNVAQSVTLTADEPATIYYTTNGSTPTTSSPIYSIPITVSATTTLKFFAKDTDGNSSAVSTEAYVINIVPPPASSKVPVMEGWWLVPAAFMGIGIMRRRRKS